MKKCVVTGPTSGIGLATSFEMAKLKYHLILIGRNEKKLEKLKKKLTKNTKNTHIDFFVADLSQINEVKQVAEDIKAKFSEIDILINNAGVYQFKRKTVNEMELTFVVNHLAYFILTLKLLPLLKQNKNQTRIVNVSSNGHYGVKFNFDDYNREIKYKGFQVYCETKLANLLFTYKLVDLLEEHKINNVTVNAVHPGVVRTNLVRSVPIIGKLFKLNPILKNAKDGAQTTVFVATSSETAGITGKYFANKKEHKSSEESFNKENQDKLWKLSEKITDTSFNLD
ncbi:MAG: SDR family NAD(P)-dependent oxidoreductase [Candidatus Heimdallarchaeota archaeon]